MTKLDRFGLLGILLVATASGTYALAQPKPAPTKPSPSAPAVKPSAVKPGEAPATCEHCNPDANKGGPHGGMMMGMHDCPMMQGGAPMAEATVENTKQGALIRLTAKNAADVTKVQEMAQKIAQHITSGCAMHHEGHEGHGDKH